MPIVNATIKAQVTALIEQTKVLEQQQSADAFAQGIANIIEAALLSCIVTIPTGGVIVATAGSAAAQTGANTAPAIGTLS